MKTKSIILNLLTLAAALACALTFTTARAQELPTSGTIESQLGKIELKNGYPTEATAKKIYDHIDFQRACQAYLWALPLMAMVGPVWPVSERQPRERSALNIRLSSLSFSPSILDPQSFIV